MALSASASLFACGARRGVDVGESTPPHVGDDAAPTTADATHSAGAATDAAPIDAAVSVAAGAVSGTAFWLGPLPPSRADRPLHLGDAHPRDWEGAEDADYAALEDVVISAVPLRAPSASSPAEPASWPQTGTLSCHAGSGQCPPYVTVATGDQLELVNATRGTVAWHFVKDGRVRQTVLIFASRVDPPATTDISGLDPGAYEIIERGSTTRVGWLYRAAPGEIVVGPTSGNGRYSMTLTTGSYQVVAWHPHLTPVEKPVDIQAKTIRRVNPVFTARQLRK